jgi:tetratricopeptide (TPR) repeat protein
MNIEENYQYAIKYLREGKLQQAANICLEILETHPGNSIVTHFLGIICYRLNNYDLAIECFRKTVQLNPNFTEAYNSLGAVLQENGQFDDAISFHQKATQLDPKSGWRLDGLEPKMIQQSICSGIALM